MKKANAFALAFSFILRDAVLLDAHQNPSVRPSGLRGSEYP